MDVSGSFYPPTDPMEATMHLRWKLHCIYSGSFNATTVSPKMFCNTMF